MVHSEGRMSVPRVGCAMTLRKKVGGSGGDRVVGDHTCELAFTSSVLGILPPDKSYIKTSN